MGFRYDLIPSSLICFHIAEPSLLVIVMFAAVDKLEDIIINVSEIGCCAQIYGDQTIGSLQNVPNAHKLTKRAIDKTMKRESHLRPLLLCNTTRKKVRYTPSRPHNTCQLRYIEWLNK